MKSKLIALILVSLILVVFVATWGDNFKNQNYRANDRVDYFINYAELKDEYINQKSYLSQKNIDSYDLRYAARKLEDYDFEKYIIDQVYKDGEGDRDAGYKSSLIEYYLNIEDYDQAEKIYYELNGPLVISDKNKINKLESYVDLINIYYGQKNKEEMEKLYQMSKEDKDMLGESYMTKFGNDSLSKIIEITGNEEIKNEIMNQAVQAIEIQYDLIFILEETGYRSKEMEEAIDMAERLINKGHENSKSFKGFLYFYPVFKEEKLVELYSDLLITEIDDKYRLRYFNGGDKLEVTNEMLIDKPISYKVYNLNNFVMKSIDNLLLVQYESSYLIREKKGTKLVDSIIEDDLIIRDNKVTARGLDLVIEVEGSFKNRELLLEDGLILELVRFEKDGKLTDVILNEYKILETGYIILANMKKII